jgi:subtilisin family serine protease
MYYKTLGSREKLFALSFLWLFSVTALLAQNFVGGKRIKQGLWENRQIDYVDGDIAVILKAGVNKNNILPLLQKHGATIKRDFDKLGWGLIELPTSHDVLSKAFELKQSPLLKAAEPNMVNRVQSDPNDPFFLDGHQWALWNRGQNPPSGTSGADINMRNAWEISRGSSNVIIAVLDTGVPLVNGSLSHPDLDDPNKFILGADFVDVPADGVRDNSGHGTHVTGIISAETDNGVGIAGIAGNCRILAIQVFDANGSGSDAAFYNGVIYAVDNGAKIINYSGGGSPSDTKQLALEYAKGHDVVLVASAGNSCGGPVKYPAAYSNFAWGTTTIAVSATNHNDVITEYSNAGPEINVSAPGGHGTTNVCQTGYVYYDSDDIYSTTPNYPFNFQIRHPEITQNYGYLAGTSMAAPHVSGVAALLRSINSTLFASEVRDILQASAIDKGPAGFDNTYGHGRIDAYQALLRALAYANKSMSANATAGNNSRRLVKDSNGYYNLVFESGTTTGGQEIFYRFSTDGINWTVPHRLSAGNGGNASPCISERNGKLYVIWQRWDGSAYDVLFRSTYIAGGGWSNIQQLSPNHAYPPTPVITSPATNKLMAVWRGNIRLLYRTSNDNGINWTATTQVPSTGTNDLSPTLAPIIINGGGGTRSCLIYARTPGSIHYRYYIHGPDSAESWNASVKNLSQIVPGSYNNHKAPSITPSGTAGNQHLHVAWEAAIAATGERVIIHRKATNWGTWPSVYSVLAFILNQPQLPSITGLANDSAELLFQGFDLNNIYKRHDDGSTWGGTVFLAAGTNPSVSIGNTTAKYVWTSGSAAPYQIQTSTETLSKISGKQLATVYHRSIAVIDTTTGNWLEVRLDKLAVKTKSGEEFAVPFAEAKEDAISLTPANAFANLASSWSTLPADAESLFVRCQVNGQGLSAIKDRANRIGIEIALAKKNGASLRLPVITTSSESLPATVRTISIAASNLAGGEISLRAQVSGIENKSSLIASLGHIYEVVEAPIGKTLEAIAQNATPQDYALSAYPNPFSANGTFGNPATQIRFTMKEAGLAMLRVYNLNGQLVRELLHEPRAAGEYALPWDGRDPRGVAAASGVYFIRFETGHEVKLSKVMLVR